MRSGPGRELAQVITWRLHLSSSPESVYRALCSDRGRESFWVESSAECNGEIEMRFINGSVCRARILEQVEAERFVLEYFGSRVCFDLADDGAGGTDLSMTNSGYLPAEREEILAGWLNVLLPLKSAVDYQVDLRNHDPGRTWDQRYVDQ